MTTREELEAALTGLAQHDGSIERPVEEVLDVLVPVVEAREQAAARAGVQAEARLDEAQRTVARLRGRLSRILAEATRALQGER